MRKKLLLLPALFFAAINFTQAQVWLELGAKGMMGMTGLANANINGDADHDSSLGFATSLGGVANLNVGDYHGLTFEMLGATYSHSMTYRGAAGNRTVNMEWESIDAYLLYRFFRSNGAFAELGGKATYLRGAQQSFGTDWSDVSGKYTDRYWSGCFGVGGFVTANKVLTVKTGIRAEYAFTDLMSAEGQAENYPTFYTNYDTYEETQPFRIGFYMEVTFGVGGIAQSQCGARGVIFGTGYN
ncbi:hypothetical protein [Phaeodactylibacter sp.]|uniref:hypothetical protein n=1 Tax=Phaeodactylibacter sp. TaxID=1940289 RepID=UPI00260077F9|nr:hypothetical protein [Phaeodactylibacter sp.]MCI4646639.1 hypothetical protein [Phaeodactylibacter sp.]MCI5093732.1 hypothetical protein [Phaeodactylibacter sp.]